MNLVSKQQTFLTQCWVYAGAEVIDATFFRLLSEEDKPGALACAVAAERVGSDQFRGAFSVSPASFRQVPGTPFAYWVSDPLRRKFVELPSVEGGGRTVKQGLATADDFRFVRASWEVAPVRIPDSTQGPWRDPKAFHTWCLRRTNDGARWVPYAKGGEFSPFFADIHLVVNWEKDGNEVKAHICERYPYLNGKWEWVAKNTDFYFLPGLTWSRRTQGGFSVRALPSGCIFADKGPVILSSTGSLPPLLGVANSATFLLFVNVQMAFGSYEVGVIQRTPVPDLSDQRAIRVAELSSACVGLLRARDSDDETSHVFRSPALYQVEGRSLTERMTLWREDLRQSQNLLQQQEVEIDELVRHLYEIGEVGLLDSSAASLDTESEPDVSRQEDVEVEVSGSAADIGSLTVDVISYAVGCVVGRWDVRIGLDSTLAARQPDPFAPMPVCSPGTLVGPGALPATKDRIVSEEWLRARPDAISLPPNGSVQRAMVSDTDYLLDVAWDGVLVDDPEHPRDVVTGVRRVLDLLWDDRADAIEQEACEILGVNRLRDYFGNPRGFFEDHVSRYSKSRRKAPIYWLLQSSKRSYGLWLYYHRLDADLLFKALTNFVDPKLQREEGRLADLRSQKAQAGSTGGAARQAERAIERQEALIAELRDFRDKLNRAASLGLKPDLDDGVVLNAAPLWELMPWKVAKDYWQELLKGEYAWSSIGKQLRAKKLVAAP
jgi:hypothetical protein